MDAYTLYDYWYVLYRKRVTIYLIVLFSIIFAAGLSWLLPGVYQPRAVFFVPSKPDSMTFYSENSSGQVARLPLMPEAKLDDGWLDIAVVSAKGPSLPGVYTVLLLDGLAQAAGLGMLIGGLVAHTRDPVSTRYGLRIASLPLESDRISVSGRF